MFYFQEEFRKGLPNLDKEELKAIFEGRDKLSESQFSVCKKHKQLFAEFGDIEEPIKAEGVEEEKAPETPEVVEEEKESEEKTPEAPETKEEPETEDKEEKEEETEKPEESKAKDSESESEEEGEGDKKVALSEETIVLSGADVKKFREFEQKEKKLNEKVRTMEIDKVVDSLVFSQSNKKALFLKEAKGDLKTMFSEAYGTPIYDTLVKTFAKLPKMTLGSLSYKGSDTDPEGESTNYTDPATGAPVNQEHAEIEKRAQKLAEADGKDFSDNQTYLRYFSIARKELQK